MQMRLQRWCRQTRLTKVMSKSEALICKSPTIALEEGIVDSGGELGEMKQRKKQKGPETYRHI